MSDIQDNDPTGLPPCSECQECRGLGGRWDDEAIDQWYWCCHCDAAVIAAAKSQKYDSTYKGQLKKCGDERSALEQTVDDLSKENKQLRADLIAAQGYRAAAEEIAKRRGEMVDALTAERDEARRTACLSEARYMNFALGFYPRDDDEAKARNIAVRSGWDCFEKEGER